MMETRETYIKEREKIVDALGKKKAELMVATAEIEALEKQQASHAELETQLRKHVEKDNSIKESLEKELALLDEQISCLKINIESAKKELSTLSFMAFGRKKELKTKLDADQSALTAAEAKCLQKQKEFTAVASSASVASLAAEEEIVRNLSENIQNKEVAISSLKKEIAKSEEQLAELAVKIEEVDAEIEEKRTRKPEDDMTVAAEAKAAAEEDAKARLAEERAKKKAEDEMRAKIEAEMRAKFDQEAREKVEQEAKLRAVAEAKAAEEAARSAKLEAELKAKKEVKSAVKSLAQEKPKTGSTPKFKRPIVSDRRLAQSLDRAFDKLEAYYPEGKVFAFDSVDSKLRERMSELYKSAGYATIDEMLKAYGFEIISGDAVKKLRSFVMYSPGKEPDVIKNKVDNMLALMEEYYPDRIVTRGMQNDHKKLSQTVSGLYQWLGYDSAGDMLRAYGFEYNVGDSGRPANDYQPILDALVEKYKTAPKPKSMGELLFDNPEIKAPLKTLQNKANEVFGMTLNKYFQQIGILDKGVRGYRTASANVSESAIDSLQARYENIDVAEYGTAEEAVACLENMNVKRNKAGEIYIFRAAGCEGTVKIPYGIDFISDGAFMKQVNLETVYLSASIAEIPSEAFRGCSNLTTLLIPEGVISIEAYAFAECTALRSIVLPKSLQKIAAKAFAGCAVLESVELQNPRTIISQDAFDGCQYKYVPEKEIDTTDAKLFKYTCDRKGNVTITGFNGTLEQVVIPGIIDGNPVSAIGKGAFQGNKYLVDVTMPDFITTMQGDAFRDCISLRKIHLSNSISRIITNTFNGCIGLEEVNIPDAVTEIKRSTFKDSPLKTLHIGKSLSVLESRPFYNGEHDPFTGRRKTTRAIKRITVDSENPYLSVAGAAVLSKDGKTLFAFLGNDKSYAVPEGVETIGAYAFEDLAFLADVGLPDSLIEIQKKAFCGTSLRSISVGANLKSIQEYAFSNCDKLTAAVFESGIEEIGDHAFSGCPIVSVYLPASLKMLGASSFSCLSGGYYGDHKQSFVIDSANPYLKTDGKALYSIADDGQTLLTLYGRQFKEYVYDNRHKTPEYEVATGTRHIAPSAFSNCQSLGKVTLPEGVVSIGESAFAGCASLKEIVLPESVETIGAFAFRGSSIKEFKLGAAVREIGESAFVTGIEWQDKRTKLRGIKVDKANAVFYVDKKALYKNKVDGSSAVMAYFGGDEVFALPGGVSEICTEAFARSIVQEVQIPSSVTAIGERAFSGCSKLIRLRVGFAEPENGAHFAVVYIPEISGGNEYADSTIRDQYMDCIRVDGSGTVFDFVKYDSLFETIKASKDKILVATDRLKSAIQLVPLYRDKYLAYLRRNAKKAVEVVVEFDDLSGLNTLAELGVFTGKNIDAVIELANKAKKTEILSYLMNYKNSKIGITEEDYDL